MPTAPARSRTSAKAALAAALQLQRGASLLGGADRIALLEAVRDAGSMTRAAQAVGISYKTAWDRVQGMANVSPEPLVERRTGGAGGGGTRLTAYATELVEAFRALEASQAQVHGRLERANARSGDLLQTLATLGLRTSARNQLVGIVTAVQRGAVNAVVSLRLPGGDDIVHATLTLASVRELGLKRGVQAVALIKAPSVFVAADVAAGDGSPLALSVRNALQATLTAVRIGAVNTEVQARLAGGQTMVAMVSAESARRLGLRVGAAVRLLFQESSVIVGVV